MNGNASSAAFVSLVEQQLQFLRDEEEEGYTYKRLHVYVSGVPAPWKFKPADEFDFNEAPGFLIVRTGPTDEDNNNNADVPEHVFRLDTIVATQLV
jgi:hypothetical protein